jgi:hypothetical protein
MVLWQWFRGYGKIKFIGLKQNNQDIQQKFDQLDAFCRSWGIHELSAL